MCIEQTFYGKIDILFTNGLRYRKPIVAHTLPIDAEGYNNNLIKFSENENDNLMIEQTG